MNRILFWLIAAAAIPVLLLSVAFGAGSLIAGRWAHDRLAEG